MSNRHTYALVVLLVCSGSYGLTPAFAHGDLHERIDQLSAQIAAQTNNPALLLQRSDLRRQHGDFAGALADANAADQLQASRRSILLAQARIFSDAGQITNAFQAANDALALEPASVDALLLRAHSRLKLNQTAAAVEDFTTAITFSKRAEPDTYLDRARAQAALGRFEDAIQGLDAGMARIGAVDALQLAALEYERQRGDFDAALKRLSKHVTSQPVKEPWAVLRGEILLQAGRLVEAKREFHDAASGIQSWPGNRRELEMTQQLTARIQTGLARIEARTVASNKR